jgi:hypothetical protein
MTRRLRNAKPRVEQHGKVMNQKTKDRLYNAVIIALFLVILSGCVWWIIHAMTKWKIKGLG